jgi:hypothetical protein
MTVKKATKVNIITNMHAHTYIYTGVNKYGCLVARGDNKILAGN